MHFRSIDDMNHAILRGLARIPRDVDLVVGIPRSGLLAASMVSLYLNLPLCDLAGLFERRLLATGKRPVPNANLDVFVRARRVLVLDDCVSQGTEMRRARERIAGSEFADRALFATVYNFPERRNVADLVFEVIPRPMCFQWSFMHTPSLAHYCVDIDGVLCADPAPEQDDDGARYRDFLDNAVPLLVPTAEVGWLVTCRLERYRAQTERWLDRNGIRYRHLVMMQHDDREERQRRGRHAEYKADAYVKSGAELLVESSPGLSARIADLSQHPVLCMDTGRLLRRPTYEVVDIARQRIGWWRRRVGRAPRRMFRALWVRGRTRGVDPSGPDGSSGSYS